MLYSIRLRISYDYDSPADVGRHLLRIMPASIPGVQEVQEARLLCRPVPAEQLERVDFFGNTCTEIAYRTPLEETVFEMEARVERLPSEPGLDVSPPPERLAQQIAEVPSVAGHAPQSYLPVSPRVRQNAEIAAWAAGVVEGAETVLAQVMAVTRALHRDMAFDATATMVDTPLDEAFALRRGVCQDFTHIQICALRSLGIPAGYVSGFLRTLPPEGQERLEGADAMHAWVRAWCGKDMGWVEVDPTNDMPAGTDHVVIARGRDYFDVAPVKGSMRLAGGQRTSQAVDMEAV
ncbi:Transglutaminase-like enzyme, putative cysteine protease [Pseudooceanicola antarcticus]|uniref:Transglutaminase family protein n=1 Tax=Pseudooceanicola antarcticus TaxID=1247613 RepID=A0A285IN19_9RHOB|nr:transglutaminase family protein [Pseudooceanicola antarcticus]PJE28751.1 transglutaminase family protein [Pseudooceanicola antarcticus]SNY48351.1 Transglutaminase-like enzyme, putative cysteine protease [Pseudooceanicola antarcticus]